MKALRNLLILGLAGWIAWNALAPKAPGDRPTLTLSNGPLRLEVASDGREMGRFEQSRLGGNAWYYHHPAQGPSHYQVVVRDSTCGSEATYDATEMTVLAGGSGSSSNITIDISGFGPFTSLEVDPDSQTKLARSAPARLDIGDESQTLEQVRVAGSTCAFTSGEGSIEIGQRH